MKVEINEAILKLDAHRNLTFNKTDSGCIHVHWGDVWVTRKGDSNDHIIRGGESMVLDRSDKTVLTALSDAGISIMDRCRPLSDEVGNDSRETKVITSADVGRAALPGYETVDFHVDRAHQLRAQYIGEVFSRGWSNLRRALLRLG